MIITDLLKNNNICLNYSLFSLRKKILTFCRIQWEINPIDEAFKIEYLHFTKFTLFI